MSVLTKPLQLTLAIIKPHVISNPVVLNEIRHIIVSADFKVVKSRKCKLLQEEAELFYEEHKKKFFFNRLVTFMTSGSIELYILAKENAIADWRKLMGPTKVFKAQYEAPESIRGRFGLSDTRNATHGSDSDVNVRREIGIFFPKFDVDKWLEKEEPIFRKGDVVLNSEYFCHQPICDKNMHDV